MSLLLFGCLGIFPASRLAINQLTYCVRNLAENVLLFAQGVNVRHHAEQIF